MAGARGGYLAALVALVPPGARAKVVFARGVVAYHAFFFIHRHAGEIAHVLVRAGKLVEQRRLAGILVACQCKYHQPRASPPCGASPSVIFCASSKRRVSS